MDRYVLAEAHPVYPDGPPCNPYCPGESSMYHDGYADGYENAEGLATPQPEAGLDAAWAEAEAALPEGGVIDSLVRSFVRSPGGWTARAGWLEPINYGVHPTQWRFEGAFGLTPAAALLALAAALREPKP